jgi:hypothetical protein
MAAIINMQIMKNAIQSVVGTIKRRLYPSTNGNEDHPLTLFDWLCLALGLACVAVALVWAIRLVSLVLGS